MQQISEFCKVKPFFMLYVVHRSNEMVDSMGKERYQLITNRFHTCLLYTSRYYTRYCKEHPSESEEESRSEVSSMEDMPSAQLESDDISHADERTQSDAQEIPKSPQVDLPARESPDQGIPPAISEAKPQEQAQASAFKAQEKMCIRDRPIFHSKSQVLIASPF